MPELPEVTTIANQLRQEVQSLTIESVENFSSYRTEPEFSAFKKGVTGGKIKNVFRVAKTIVLELEKETLCSKESPSEGSAGKPLYLVFHLAMTGRLLLRNKGDREDPWTRLVFCLKKEPPGSAGRSLYKELRFCDARMFGFVKLLSEGKLQAHRSRYGPDALSSNLTPEELLSNLRRKKTSIKKALLDQELLAGVGNIYANDSLWMAKIHPQTPTSRLDENQVVELLDSLRKILAESIAHRGSTLEDKMYIDLYGREGSHQNYFRIFGRGGKPCPRCSTPIEYLEIGGRASFFCSRCQPASPPLTKGSDRLGRDQLTLKL